jgi:DNA mismatch repair ATPase MutS
MKNKDKIFELKEAISLIDSFVLKKNYHPDYDHWKNLQDKLKKELEELQKKSLNKKDS